MPIVQGSAQVGVRTFSGAAVVMVSAAVAFFYLLFTRFFIRSIPFDPSDFIFGFQNE